MKSARIMQHIRLMHVEKRCTYERILSTKLQGQQEPTSARCEVSERTVYYLAGYIRMRAAAQHFYR